MKVLADTEDKGTKLILIGINKAGQQLINFGADVGLRIDIFRLEANSPEKILELVAKGEEALNISIENKADIAERAVGSFQITQLLCHKLCVLDAVTSTQDQTKVIDKPIDAVVETVMSELSRQFFEASSLFARGPKMKSAGRAPYLHLLKWLSTTDDGALDIREAIRLHTDMRGSVGQVLDKGFLERHLEELPAKAQVIESMLFYDKDSALLGAEDPKYLFYLRNLVWRAFGRRCGFAGDYFRGKYDYALSFAGTERAVAEKLYHCLNDHEVAVFYDFAEQHNIAGANIEAYLAPIYRSEARFVVVLLSKEYPRRIWTKFESDQFKDRFGSESVIAIRYNDIEPGYFGEDAQYGTLPLDPDGDIDGQIAKICGTLLQKISNDREESEAAQKREEEPALPGMK